MAFERAREAGVRVSAFWSLRVRTLLLVFVAVSPAFWLMAYTAREQRHRAADLMRDNTLRLARLAATDASGRVEGAREFLSALSEFPEVRAMNAPACQALVSRLRDDYPDYANFGVISPRGFLIASAVPSRRPVYVGDRTYYQRCVKTRDFAVGDYQVGRITGVASVNFASPVYGAGNRFVGVVYAALNVDWVGRIAEWRLPERSSLTFMSAKGVVILRYPEPARFSGKAMPESKVARTILAEKEGTVEGAGLDGVHRLYAFTPLTVGPEADRAYMSIGVPLDAVYGDVDLIFQRNLAGMAVVALIALVAAWLGGDWFFLRQVKALMLAARRLSQGDLSARTGLSYGRDELSLLTYEFDEMADSLERLTGEHDLILRSAGEGIVGLDGHGVATFVNPAAARMLGFTVEEMVGVHTHGQVHHTRPDGSPYPVSECPMWVAYSEGSVRRGDDEILWRKDGTSFPIDYVATPAWEHGQIVGAVVIFKDITERKRAEQEVAQAHEEVIQAAQERKRFHREIIRSVTNDKLHLVDAVDILTEGRLVAEGPLEKPEEDRICRKRLREIAEKAGMDADRAGELVMAVGEASTNAVKHATGGRWAIYQTSDRVIARISDHGAGIPTEELPASLLQPGYSTKVSMGMGYTIMLELADRVWLSTGPSGTTLQLEKWIIQTERPASPLLAAVQRMPPTS